MRTTQSPGAQVLSPPEQLTRGGQGNYESAATSGMIGAVTGVELEFPDDLPAACPPHDARSPGGVYYRFVKHDPPKQSDFVRPRDLPRARALAVEEMCKASALSVFTDEDDILIAQVLVKGMNSKKIAQATLEAQDGLMKKSPMRNLGPDRETLTSHFSWWVAVAVQHGLSGRFRTVGIS